MMGRTKKSQGPEHELEQEIVSFGFDSTLLGRIPRLLTNIDHVSLKKI